MIRLLSFRATQGCLRRGHPAESRNLLSYRFPFNRRFLDSLRHPQAYGETSLGKTTLGERGIGMKKLLAIAVVCVSLLVAAQDSAPKAPPSERHEFVIANLHTENGVTLPKAIIVYGTYGHLNAARDNVILVPSHYMADYHGYEWVIGDGHRSEEHT